jgi:hypothetical protein
MIPFPNARCNTHLIHTETLDCNQLLMVFKELGFHWRIGHEDEAEDGNNEGEQTTEEKDDLVKLVEFILDMDRFHILDRNANAEI